MGEVEQKSAWVFYMPWSLIFLYLAYIAIGCAGIVLEYDLVLYHGWLQSAIITVLLMAAAIAVFRRKIVLHDREQQNYTTGRMTNGSIYGTVINNLK